MFILLHKLNEDVETVLYKFETDIWETLQEFDQRGYPKQILKTVWDLVNLISLLESLGLTQKKHILTF